jgi:hypothetical protein
MGVGINATPKPLYFRKREVVRIVQEEGWTQGRSGRVRNISTTPGFDFRTVPPVASRNTD